LTLFGTLVPSEHLIYKRYRDNKNNTDGVLSVAAAFAQKKQVSETDMAVAKLALVRTANEQWNGIKRLLFDPKNSFIPAENIMINPGMKRVQDFLDTLAQLGIAEGRDPKARYDSVFGTTEDIPRDALFGKSPRTEVTTNIVLKLGAMEKDFEAASKPAPTDKREAMTRQAQQKADAATADIEAARTAAAPLKVVPKKTESEGFQTVVAGEAWFLPYQEDIIAKQRDLAKVIGEKYIALMNGSAFNGSYTLRSTNSRGRTVRDRYNLKQDAVTALQQLVKQAQDAGTPGTTVPGMTVIRLEDLASALQALTDAREVVDDYKKGGNKKTYEAVVEALNYNMALLLSTMKENPRKMKPEDPRKNAMLQLERVLHQNDAADLMIAPRVAIFLMKARWEYYSSTSENLTKDSPVMSKKNFDEFIGYAEDAVKHVKAGPLLEVANGLLLEVANGLIERCKKASQEKTTTSDEMFRLTEQLEAGVVHMVSLYEKEEALKQLPGKDTPQFKNAKDAYSNELDLFRLAFGNPDCPDAHPATMPDLTLESLVTIYPRSLINMENSFFGWHHSAYWGTVSSTVPKDQKEVNREAVYGDLNKTERVLVAALSAKKELFFPWTDAVSDKSGLTAARELLDDSVPQGIRRDPRYRRNADTATMDDLSRGMLPYIEEVWAPYVANLRKQGYPLTELDTEGIAAAKGAAAKGYGTVEVTQLSSSPESLMAQYSGQIAAGNKALSGVLTQLAADWRTLKGKQDASGISARLAEEAKKPGSAAGLLYNRAFTKYKLVVTGYEDEKIHKHVAGLVEVYGPNASKNLYDGSVDGAWANPVRAIQLLTTAVKDLQDAESRLPKKVVPSAPVAKMDFSIALDRSRYENKESRFATLSWSAEVPLAPLLMDKVYTYMSYEEDTKSRQHCYYAMSDNESAHGVKRIARLSEESDNRTAYFYTKWDYKADKFAGWIDARDGWATYGAASKTSDADLERKGVKRFVFEHVYTVKDDPETNEPKFEFDFRRVSVSWLRDAFRMRVNGDELAKRLKPGQTSYSFSFKLANGGEDMPPGVYMNEYTSTRFKVK
jgi:hypothetical protein